MKLLKISICVMILLFGCSYELERAALKSCHLLHDEPAERVACLCRIMATVRGGGMASRLLCEPQKRD